MHFTGTPFHFHNGDLSQRPTPVKLSILQGWLDDGGNRKFCELVVLVIIIALHSYTWQYLHSVLQLLPTKTSVLRCSQIYVFTNLSGYKIKHFKFDIFDAHILK